MQEGYYIAFCVLKPKSFGKQIKHHSITAQKNRDVLKY